MVIIDREHVKSLDEASRVLRQYFEVMSIMKLTNDSIAFKVKRGLKEATIYLVLMGGGVGCIEWNLALLVKKLYDIEIMGDTCDEIKVQVRRWFRERNLRDYKIVQEAPRRAFEEAFSELASVLKMIVDDP